MRTVIWTDIFQLTIMVFGLLMILVIGLMEVGSLITTNKQEKINVRYIFSSFKSSCKFKMM